MNLLFLVAAVLFAIAGLANPLDWNLGEFDAIAWGLFSLALGHLLAGYVSVPVRRRRGL